MAINLLNLVKDQFSDNLVSKAASLIGVGEGSAKSAITSMLPSLLGGIGSKASTLSGASSLLSMIKDNDLGEGTLNNLSSTLSGDGAEGFLSKGADMASGLFGNDHGSMLTKISSLTGIGKEGSGKLMGLATPVALGALGKIVKSENLDAAGLKDYLGNQTASFASGISGGSTRTQTTTTTTERSDSSGGGGGFLKWLLPLLLLLGALWWFMNRGKSTETATTSKTEQTATDRTANTQRTAHTHTHADGTVHHGSHDHDHDHGGSTAKTTTTQAGNAAGNVAATAANAAGGIDMAAVKKGQLRFKVDDTGNLVNGLGKIVAKKGEFEMKDGIYVGKDGSPLGNFLKKVGDAVGNAAEKTGDAIGNAATKTADAFKTTFGSMFAGEKKAAAGTKYSMNKIVFDKDSHKITNFSKNEVEGLAAALKANPNSKIQVQVHSNDAGSDKENQKVSKLRAQVVHDMLVTLGVKDGQISAKGMGSEDAAKAAAGKVEIMVE